MIGFEDFFIHANSLIRNFNGSQIDLRRAESSLYYALFHQLISMATSVFSQGGPELRNQAGRAYNHISMRRVCEAYARADVQKLSPTYANIAPTPVSKHLVFVAQTFVQLQNARHTADYDLSISLSYAEVLLLSLLAGEASAKLDAIANEPGTHVFLAALLLADRWSKRG